MTKCNGTKFLPNNSISLTFWTLVFTENIRYPFNIFPVIGIWGAKYLKTNVGRYIETHTHINIYATDLYSLPHMLCLREVFTGFYGSEKNKKRCLIFFYSISPFAVALSPFFLFYLTLCGRRRVAVARYRMICLVLISYKIYTSKFWQVVCKSNYMRLILN